MGPTLGEGRRISSHPDRSNAVDGEASDVLEGTLIEPGVELLDIPSPARTAMPATIELGSAGIVEVVDAPDRPHATLPALRQPPSRRSGPPRPAWLPAGGAVALAAVVLLGLAAAGLVLQPPDLQPNGGAAVAGVPSPAPDLAPTEPASQVGPPTAQPPLPLAAPLVPGPTQQPPPARRAGTTPPPASGTAPVTTPTPQPTSTPVSTPTPTPVPKSPSPSPATSPKPSPT